MARILVVEDDPSIRRGLEMNLQLEGFETVAAEDGRQAMDALDGVDLVILDIMLPHLNGYQVCRRLRADGHDMPIILLSAKTGEVDIVRGLELGADDYVTKPFSVRELMLRVRALLRRRQVESKESNQSMTFGALRVDVDAHQAWIEEEELSLTAIEFKLLSVLMNRKGRVQSRQQLLNDVWGIQADVTTRTVDTHVKRLRQKLGKMGDAVETLRSVGYRFRANPEK